MKYLKNRLLLCFFLIVSLSKASVVDTIKTRVLNDLIFNANQIQEKDVIPFINSMLLNGSWNDINYKSSAVADDWEPSFHLDRLKNMCYVYMKNGQNLYLNKGLLTKIDSGLTYWFKVNPSSPNWWHNDIGKQMRFNIIGLLMEKHLRKELLTKIVNTLSAVPKMTGANLTDISTSVIYRGLIEGDLNRIKSGLNAISSEIKLSSGEGFKIDNSFHQHGAFLYNGGYGLVFLNTCSFWAEKTATTTLAFTQPKIAILTDMLLKGNCWMIRGNVMDYSTEGRGFTRTYSGQGKECMLYLRRMANANISKKNELTAAADRIQKGERQDISGNRHFWKSDFSAHHRASFYTSVKMCSKRTVGIEGGNGENLKGYWLPFGLNYIYRKGNEYQDIFPMWDWGFLPGVTNPNTVLFPGPSLSQSETFVGGVSDSTYGVAAMKLNIQNTTARKAWFLFDKELVALGTGINSTNTNEINTTINQTGLNANSLIVNGNSISKGVYKYDSLNWILNDSIAYIFPEKKTIVLKAQTQSGSWYNINNSQPQTVFSKDVFTLYFPHGKTPVNASYQYAVVPSISPTEAANYYKNIPFLVLKNTSQIQAVNYPGIGVTGIVFYEPGTVAINGSLSVSVNRSCILLVKKVSNNKYSVTIADPERTQAQIVCTLYNKNNIGNSYTFKMPSGDNSGKSVSANIDLPIISNVEYVDKDSLELDIYPQPSNGVFNVSFFTDHSSDLIIYIFDNLGKMVYMESLRNYTGNYHKVINLSEQPSGLYIMKIRVGERFKTYKLCIEK